MRHASGIACSCLFSTPEVLMSSRFRNVLLAVAATTIWVSGCTGGDSPTAPRAPSSPRQVKAATAGASTTTSGSSTADAQAIDQLARFRTKPQITIAWAKAWIGPEGGRMDFLGFTVIVPPGAVDKVTMFTIRLPVDPNGSEHVVAEFGPHGQQFAVPVTIGFPYHATSIEGDPNAHVVWWDNGWVDMGGTVSADGTQIFTTAQKGGTLTASGG
jgi:hypothetical protein